MTKFEDGQTIDLDCGCVLEYRGDLELWVVGGFCEEHDPTIIEAEPPYPKMKIVRLSKKKIAIVPKNLVRE
jgi:hypothetical protein